MVEQLDAYRIADKISDAFSEGTDAVTRSQKLREVNVELRYLQPEEQVVVMHETAMNVLLPELAIATGVVTEKDANRDEVMQIYKKEGLSSLKGMAAKYVLEDFGNIEVFGGKEHKVNSRTLEVRDQMEEDRFAAIHTNREYHGLVEQLRHEYPDNPEIQKKQSLTREDIDLLLLHPEALHRDYKQALQIMRDRFDDLSDGEVINDWSLRKFSRLPWPFSDFMSRVSNSIEDTKLELFRNAFDAQKQRQYSVPPDPQ